MSSAANFTPALICPRPFFRHSPVASTSLREFGCLVWEIQAIDELPFFVFVPRSSFFFSGRPLTPPYEPTYVSPKENNVWTLGLQFPQHVLSMRSPNDSSPGRRRIWSQALRRNEMRLSWLRLGEDL